MNKPLAKPAVARSAAAGLAAAVLTLAACGSGGTNTRGTAETDRQAETIARAISYPRQSSAAGLADAARATSRAQSSGFAVLEARDLEAKTLLEPLAHLVIQLHSDESESGLQKNPAVTACYGMYFNYYGIMSKPYRMHCPK